MPSPIRQQLTVHELDGDEILVHLNHGGVERQVADAQEHHFVDLGVEVGSGRDSHGIDGRTEES